MKKQLIGAIMASIVMVSTATADDKEVNIYTLRQPELLQPILDEFTNNTGIKVNATWVKDGILARLQAEGDKSQADAVLTVDVSRLSEISQAGLFEAIDNTEINSKVPEHLRQSNGEWFGLTKRARVIITSKERVSEPPLTYEDLADPKWQGKVCTRSGKHVYNIGVIASMIAAHGVDDAKVWLEKVKANLGRKPTGNDRAQGRAIFEGVCDVALINSYYLGKMATNDKEPEQKDWYNAVNVIYPNQADRGAHVNISGIGVLKSAQNKDNAIKLIEFLLSDKAQQDYASLNFEYPVVATAQLDPIVASWGEFKEDGRSIQEIADNAEAASQLVDEVRFDF